MLQSNERIIRHKVGLLNLAEELGNVSKACQIMGLSRDTFYRYRDAVEEGGVEALLERNRRVPNRKNRVDLETENTVVAYAVECPAHGQVRVSNELRKRGVFVSASGVRSIWLRHDLANFKARLKALEAKIAEEGIILTEAQVQALEKKKLDDEAWGEIDTAHPGYLGSQDTFYVGTLKGVGRIYQRPTSIPQHHLHGRAPGRYLPPSLRPPMVGWAAHARQAQSVLIEGGSGTALQAACHHWTAPSVTRLRITAEGKSPSAGSLEWRCSAALPSTSFTAGSCAGAVTRAHCPILTDRVWWPPSASYASRTPTRRIGRSCRTRALVCYREGLARLANHGRGPGAPGPQAKGKNVLNVGLGLVEDPEAKIAKDEGRRAVPIWPTSPSTLARSGHRRGGGSPS